MKTIEAQIKKLLNDATTLAVTDATVLDNFTIGTLTKAIHERLKPDTQIRVTSKGVRVTHSRYFDKLVSAADIDAAIEMI